MVTRSIVGRFLILAVFVVAVGVVAQAALILTEGGKKVVKTASAAPLTTAAADASAAPAGDPVRVVYPGPLGDAAAPRPKLADTAFASPLAAPAPQTTAKLAQAMTGTAPDAVAPAAAAPQPAPQPSATPVAASTETDPSPATLQPTPVSTAPVDTAADPDAVPVTPQAAPPSKGVEVASLGGGAPAAQPSTAGGVNINTASVAELNSLGGGHIGQSIASHRPYKSVEDLVKKRILRRSVFDQIRNQIAAK